MKNNSETLKIGYIELRLVLLKKTKILNSYMYLKVANLDK